MARRLRFQILVELEWNQPRKFKPSEIQKIVTDAIIVAITYFARNLQVR
jgi:predicted transcriptional regulator